MAKTANSAATKALQQELKSLQKEPLEGFTVQLINDNLFEWEVAIFGPPNTLYQGGYFKSCIKFPQDYPYSPPTVRFSTKMWHPNIYENGDVCISILHPPVDDPTNTELPSEKWNPAQNVRLVDQFHYFHYKQLNFMFFHNINHANFRTVMMSIISLLNEPNTFSPANVDASVMYRRYIESKGADKEYEQIIRQVFFLINLIKYECKYV
jgi:ubiquitin-conjugating enzyme E2 R